MFSFMITAYMMGFMVMGVKKVTTPVILGTSAINWLKNFVREDLDSKGLDLNSEGWKFSLIKQDMVEELISKISRGNKEVFEKMRWAIADYYLTPAEQHLFAVQLNSIGRSMLTSEPAEHYIDIQKLQVFSQERMKDRRFKPEAKT